jgi:hypothetical protein
VGTKVSGKRPILADGLRAAPVEAGMAGIMKVSLKSAVNFIFSFSFSAGGDVPEFSEFSPVS